MNAQTLKDINHNDTVWQILRLQAANKLNKTILSVVNQRNTH